MTRRPTLDEIRRWPAAVALPLACSAYGISRSHGYELAARGEFPARVIRVGARVVVVTADIIRSLSAADQGSDSVRELGTLDIGRRARLADTRT